MKKLISAITIVAMLVSMSVSVSAWSYNFTSGPDSRDVFAAPTQTDAFVSNPHENVRNNKDAALAPPPYGVFSGDIPTDTLSPYHSQDRPSNGNPAATVTHSNLPSSTQSSGSSSTPPPASGASNTANEVMLPATSFLNSNGETTRTQPRFFNDGTMGTLEIPRFNRTLAVRSGATEANLLIGAGHISSTSAWDGNVVISGHNRGVTHNFGFLSDMRIGDTVIYTTPYGARTYEVVERRQILVEDTSILEWSQDNILKLLTCVANTPEMRLVVILNEVR